MSARLPKDVTEVFWLTTQQLAKPSTPGEWGIGTAVTVEWGFGTAVNVLF